MERKRFRWEYLAFGLFIIGYIFITIYHEPWYDEAEAWQIAKCASLKEILFINPHFEGHPPLWHLFLKLIVACNVPYEIGLKCLAGLFATASAYLIIFKSPFPTFIRYILPFNYFVFYQYGVISRPYCMMVFTIILVSLFFKKRNEKPLLYICLLFLLCLTSAIGIILAGGISIAWVWDVIRTNQWHSFKDFIKDKRVICLFVLLIFACLLILSIIPNESTRAIAVHEDEEISSNMSFYAIFMMVPDCFLTSFHAGYYGGSYGNVDVNVFSVITAAILEIIILGLLTLLSDVKKLKYFYIPLLLMVIFLGFIYSGPHHSGIVLTLFILIGWINYDDTDYNPTYKKIKQLTEKHCSTLKAIGKTGCVICLIIPLFWTLTASVNDIKYEYNEARSTAKFIKEHHLENALIYSEYSSKKVNKKVDYNLTNYGIDLNPYFQHNIIDNLGNGEDDKAYATHIVLSDEDTIQIKQHLKEKGIPDVLMGAFPLSEIYGEEISLSDYAPIYKMKSIAPSIWKTNLYRSEDGNYDFIYLRKDLLDKYGLEPIQMT